MAPTQRSVHQKSAQVEGLVAAQTVVTASDTLPPATTVKGILAALGSAGPTASTVSLTLVNSKEAPLISTPVWVTMRGSAYTGALEPGQRVHALLVNGIAALISIQSPDTWATFEAYTAASGTSAAAMTLTEPFMAAGSTYSVDLTSTAVAMAGASSEAWTQIAAGTRVRVQYNALGQVSAVKVLGTKASSGTHGTSSKSAIVRGSIGALSGTSITVNGQEYSLSPSVTVAGTAHVALTAASLLVGQTVSLTVRNGMVTRIRVFWMHPIHGTVASASATSVTIGTTTYSVAANVRVTGAGHITSLAQLTAGARVVIGFNAEEQVSWVRVLGH